MPSMVNAKVFFRKAVEKIKDNAQLRTISCFTPLFMFRLIDVVLSMTTMLINLVEHPIVRTVVPNDDDDDDAKDILVL